MKAKHNRSHAITSHIPSFERIINVGVEWHYVVQLEINLVLENMKKCAVLGTRLLSIGVIVFFSMLTVSGGIEDQSAPLAIEGYSPVSYFTKGIAEKGSKEFAVKNEEFTYYLTSAEQVALFKADPKKYKPKYKVCPYSLARGMTLPLDPTNFKVIADTLLLFHKSDAMDGLQLWDTAEESDEELFELANKQYVLLSF